MSKATYPSELTTSVMVSDRVVTKVMQDLTVYIDGPSEQTLEFLFDLYTNICPPDTQVKYKIAEFGIWPRIDAPIWTISSRAASAAGGKRPYFEPTRKRIREGRAFEAQIWDGREIDDPVGSWSFNCQRIFLRSSGLHTFVRILIPLMADANILRNAAREIVDEVEFYSGHGGLVFVFDPWFIGSAFDSIYSLARRFWGVDIEDLNDTLRLMKNRIKGVNWLTLIGQRLDSDNSSATIETALTKLAGAPDVDIELCKHGTLIVAGPHPEAGDQHRPDSSLDPYATIANALEPLFLDDHPDFPGQQFINNYNTVGWIRRFIDPTGWR